MRNHAFCNPVTALVTLLSLFALCACGDSSEGDDGATATSGLSCVGGPTGSSVGELLPDAELMDCDGNTVSLHALCDRELVWLVTFAGWCPNCRRFADDSLGPLYTRFSAEADLGMYVIITEDGNFEAPNAEYCAEVRDQYGLEMPVLFQTDRALTGAIGAPANDFNVVATKGLEVVWSAHYANSQVESQLEAAVQSLGE